MAKLVSVLTNKYLLTALALGIWMLYFDQNDFISIQERKKELQKITDNINYLNTEIAQMEKENSDINSKPLAIEQYAREHYLLKRDNEDVYVIEK